MPPTNNKPNAVNPPGTSSAPQPATSSAAPESAPTITTPVVPPAQPPVVQPPEPPPLTQEQVNKKDFEAGAALAQEGKPLPEIATDAFKQGYAVVDPKTKLRQDGPTVEQYVKAGYKAENYPPKGYAVKLSAASQAAELLPKLLTGARDALAHALQVMIANRFPDNDGGRRIAENAFEAAKNLGQTPGKATRQDVGDALEGLNTAVNHIANHSLLFPGDLDALRGKRHQLQKQVAQYDTLTAPVAA